MLPPHATFGMKTCQKSSLAINYKLHSTLLLSTLLSCSRPKGYLELEHYHCLFIHHFWQRTTCKTTVKIQSFKLFGMIPKSLFFCTKDVHAMSVVCFDKFLGTARTQKLVKYLLNWFSLFLLILRANAPSLSLSPPYLYCECRGEVGVAPLRVILPKRTRRTDSSRNVPTWSHCRLKMVQV